ncbi:class I adenylate-forming enzyme family protein [Pseudonocardia thermophila]|uniref:class I adenylate-forming enzyme family protein n=1 Tax=Pseudonocardia thermophila TaxID=1848 RepID=UPI00248E7D32|nr:AMP-binding protein [Pseudonocardia thermophila]
MIVSDIVGHYAASAPGRTALIGPDREISYGDLARRVDAWCRDLAERGVRAGDRVAVLATDRIEYAEVVLALSVLGAVWVPVNHRLAAPEVAHILADSDACGVYYTTDREHVADALRDTCAAWFAPLVLEPEERYPARYPAPRPDPDALFCLMYTSGTTGRPKGAALTHRQFLAGTYYLMCGIGITADERILQCVPQFHAGGAIYQFAHLLAGATVVLPPRFDPDTVELLAERHRATALGIVPTMMHALNDAGSTFPGVSRVMYGGSPIDPGVLTRMMDRCPADYVQTYGQTEAGVIVTVLGAEAHRRAVVDRNEELLRSCGRPLLGYEVRLGEVNGDGVGEILVRSDSVMREYWRRPDATAETLADGWLHTGDIGRWDGDGFLYLVDRKSALIISGGENVYPLEVERALCAHPDIVDAAVVGVVDERWGQRVKAYLVAPGRRPDIDELKDFCRGRIAGFKIPRVIEYVAQLPRNASGKVTKHKLS